MSAESNGARAVPKQLTFADVKPKRFPWKRYAQRLTRELMLKHMELEEARKELEREQRRKR